MLKSVSNSNQTNTLLEVYDRKSNKVKRFFTGSPDGGLRRAALRRFHCAFVLFGSENEFLASARSTSASGASAVRHAARDLHAKLSPALFELLFVEAMPIRDAVDLARFLVETTIGFVKFSIARPKTVGGSITIAAITKHEGFRWVQRQNGFGAS